MQYKIVLNSMMNLTKRQKEIVEASLEIIGEGGIQALTIKNISKKVGISEPAIYRHFDSKTQILLTILDFFIINNKQLIQQDLKQNKNVMEVIELLFNNFIKTFLEYPYLISVIFSEEIFRNDEVFKEKSSLIINENYAMITGLIRKGQEKNEIRSDLDAASLATIIMGSLRLCVKRWQMSDYAFSLKENGNRLKQTILKILLK